MEPSKFVARENELAILQKHLDAAMRGQGRICFVTGEAGSGKTALVNYFLQQAMAANPKLIVATGMGNLQTGVGDPYLLFREVIDMLTGDVAANEASGRISAENARRLRTIMVRSIQVLVEVAPELVGVLVPGAKLVALTGKAMAQKGGWMNRLEELTKRNDLLASGSDPAADQSRIFEQFTKFVRRLSAEAPIVLFLDDLQWADSASINLLFYLAREIQENRILVLGAYRPNDLVIGRGGQRHPLEPVVHELTRHFGDICIELDAIPPERSRAFVDRLLDADPNRLDESFRAALFHQTGGHALFTVELLHAMKDRGDLLLNSAGEWVAAPTLDWRGLPAKVEGVIAERIERLDEDLRELLTVGSVEGEEFWAEVVARVEAVVEREAIRMLSNELQRRHGLVDLRGLVQIGSLQLSLYRFAHNLFQQYLYNTLDQAERRYLHRDTGTVLEALFASETQVVAERLARHFEQAGLPDKAATYRLQAANKARRMSAYPEAIAHLQQGLKLVGQMPAGPARNRLALMLETALGTSLVASHGYASNEVMQAFTRARELWRAVDDPHLVIPVLFGQAVYELVRGDLAQAIASSQELLEITKKVGDTNYEMGANLTIGGALVYSGRFTEARAYLEESIVEMEPTYHAELALVQGQDPHVAALAFLGLVLWMQGYPEQALVVKDQCLALANRIDHPYSQAFASAFASQLLILLRLDETCAAQAAETLERSEGRFPMWQAVAMNTQGWLLALQGQYDEAMHTMEEAVELWESTGASTSITFLLTRMVDACRMAGRRAEGLALLAERRSAPQEVWMLAEEHRLRAELLLLEPGNEKEAEQILRQGLDIAEAQQARSFALRLATSLATLLHGQGRTEEAYHLLSEHYSQLTEGFDLPDLRDARALLATLNEGRGRSDIFTAPLARPDQEDGGPQAQARGDVHKDALGDAFSDAMDDVLRMRVA